MRGKARQKARKHPAETISGGAAGIVIAALALFNIHVDQDTAAAIALVLGAIPAVVTWAINAFDSE